MNEPASNNCPVIYVKMRNVFQILCILSVAITASCDLRSGIAKQSVEKYTSTPTPPISPTPTPIPIDPADIIEVDVSQQGDMININGFGQNTTANCTKFNRMKINGDANVVGIKGVCRQIMINGDKNEITADASMEFVFNGSENTVKYSGYPNGVRPSVVENRGGNIIEKMSADASRTKL